MSARQDRSGSTAPVHGAVQEALALYPASGDIAGLPRHSDARPVLPEDSPRRRLAELGPGALSASELLALVLGSETRATREAADGALSAVGGLFGLGRAGVDDLDGLPGIGRAKASALVAAAELGRRLLAARPDPQPAVCSPADLVALLRGRLAHLDREHFVCVLLDTKNRVVSAPTVSVGTLSASLVHPREVFKPAVKAGAASIVLAHNHPSGHTEPSTEDRRVTKRLVEAADIFGIQILDHVIIGSGFYSFKEHGDL